MNFSTAFTGLILAIPALAICGVTAYWALTGSGWWLLATVASLTLMPSFRAGIPKPVHRA